MSDHRIGIEGSPLFGDRTGVGQYAKHLTEALSKADNRFSFEIIRFWLPLKKFRLPLAVNKKLSYRLIKWFPPAVYFQTFKRLDWSLPYDRFALRSYDVILFFNFVAFPLSKKTKSVVVIHDLAFIYHKQFVSAKNQRYLEKFVPGSIKRADKLIAVSQNTRKEISTYYGIAKKNIAVVNPAVDHTQFKPQKPADINRVRDKLGIKKPYILSVATQEPRKNLEGVLDAFELLPEELKQKYCLVLVGGRGWLDEGLQARYEAVAKKYDVIRTGYLEDNDLPPVYGGAEVFVYPSFYEGFGIPPLEAMACATPVITSNNSSLPEVVGDAAIKIKADDTAELSNQIQKILGDKILARKLSDSGLVQARKFSWDKSAAELIKVLEDLDMSPDR